MTRFYEGKIVCLKLLGMIDECVWWANSEKTDFQDIQAKAMMSECYESRKSTKWKKSVLTRKVNISGEKTDAFWLVNACSSNKKTNHDMWGNRVIFTGTRIYKREAVSNKNIGLVARIRIQFIIVLASIIRSGCLPSRLIPTLPDTTGVFVAPPTLRASVAQGIFSVGPGAGP